MIPPNVTRGSVTIERIRGFVDIYFSSVELAVEFANWSVQLSIQVVPVRNGAIVDEATLSTNNSADQESNRIMWQRNYYPRAGTTITGPGALELHESNFVGMEVDVKVKRKLDRANWALQMVCVAETNAITLHSGAISLRALIRASDGV